MRSFTESIVEDTVLAWRETLSYARLHGLATAEGEPAPERSDQSYRNVVLWPQHHLPRQAQFTMGGQG